MEQNGKVAGWKTKTTIFPYSYPSTCSCLNITTPQLNGKQIRDTHAGTYKDLLYWQCSISERSHVDRRQIDTSWSNAVKYVFFSVNKKLSAPKLPNLITTNNNQVIATSSTWSWFKWHLLGQWSAPVFLDPPAARATITCYLLVYLWNKTAEMT